MPEGQQSPPPERQSGRQLNDPPADGHGVENVNSDQKKQQLQQELENLQSNPKPVTEDAVKRMFSKGEVQRD